eukprot:TRINITY_DN6563_c0_g1_i1.p1 TRINITY_DN6563_c0_g1~~TRINITY_DN6563_c0_g1_i1.p1  ORF type:complete len:112 (+),score=42.71 TRINITY_DN6563_c0_g1_i1:65-400(+)
MSASAPLQTRDADPVSSSDGEDLEAAAQQQQEHDACNRCKRRRVGLTKQVKPIVKQEVKKLVKPLVRAVTNAVVEYILAHWEHEDEEPVEAEAEDAAVVQAEEAGNNNNIG